MVHRPCVSVSAPQPCPHHLTRPPATTPTTPTAPPPSPPISLHPRASHPRPHAPCVLPCIALPPYGLIVSCPALVSLRRIVPHLPPPPPPLTARVAITNDLPPASRPLPPPPRHLSCIVRVGPCLHPLSPFTLCAASCRGPPRQPPDRRLRPPPTAPYLRASHPPLPPRRAPLGLQRDPQPRTSLVFPVRRAPCRRPPPEHARTGRPQPFPPMHHPSPPVPLKTSCPARSHRHYTCMRVSGCPGCLRATCVFECRDATIPPQSAISTCRATIPRPSDPVHRRAPPPALANQVY